jgi:hypothetical protein
MEFDRLAVEAGKIVEMVGVIILVAGALLASVAFATRLLRGSRSAPPITSCAPTSAAPSCSAWSSW